MPFYEFMCIEKLGHFKFHIEKHNPEKLKMMMMKIEKRREKKR